MNYDAKLARAQREGVKAWVDPDGYAKSIADARRAFDAEVRAENAATMQK
jgi:metallo-beta-lactamase class B